MNHILTNRTQELLNASDEEKRKYVFSDKWISYSAAELTLKKMSQLLEMPNKHRPRNILMIGATNNGKTAILNKFCKTHPPIVIDDEDHYQIPCLQIQAPYKPTPKMLYIKILDAIKFPHKPQQSLEIKESQAFHVLKKAKVKVLLIDEIHHALAGSANQQREFINCLKYISNELKISIVAAGTSDAFHVINTDPQMANRFIPSTLPRWTANEEYVSLLYTLEAMLPLNEQSKLFEPALANKILSLSEGLIGEIVTILQESFNYCLDNGKNKINSGVLDNIEYVSPKIRRKLSVNI